VKRATEIKLFN